MTEEEARTKLQDYLRSISGDTSHHLPPSWRGRSPRATKLSDGSWMFAYSQSAADPLTATEGVVVFDEQRAVSFQGALGKLVQHLGLPETEELFLGSTTYGRYQVYQRGIAIWEANPDVDRLIPDIGYAISTDAKSRGGKPTQAIAAFFDLRGFTGWSREHRRTPEEIQETVHLLEEELQAAFSRAWCRRLFAKGTGDGFMIVSEAGASEGLNHKEGIFDQGHVALFAQACATVIVEARTRLPVELAIGCGVDIGPVTRVFVLGRHDYIGVPINNAAKIQQLAWDEVCISEAFLNALVSDDVAVDAGRLAGRGWRVDPKNCIEAVLKKYAPTGR